RPGLIATGDQRSFVVDLDSMVGTSPSKNFWIQMAHADRGLPAAITILLAQKEIPPKCVLFNLIMVIR
ncbi:hypothetical protein AVEN_114764-1, partial [Araneus ventricosus]